ncbi:unnamed protein product [Polarella glacialis]|uniref:Uncharacterized protein n=1 Tax=Polarella glacialis TaxID=89957 RepID=A0A813LRY4_POLGL|nr:unnamed protein product [Polarella glacialis]
MWSSSGLKKFGIEWRQVTRDLEPPQMVSAAGSNSSGDAGACRKASRTKWFALAQSLSFIALLRFNEPSSRWHFRGTAWHGLDNCLLGNLKGKRHVRADQPHSGCS